MKPFAAIAFTLALSVPLTGLAAEGGETYRYALGAYSTRTLFSVGGACTDPVAGTGAFGVCNIPLSSARPVTITVTDDVLGPEAFRYDAFTGSYPDVACRNEGDGYGSGTFDIPAECTTLRVFVGEFATTGTIRVNG